VQHTNRSVCDDTVNTFDQKRFTRKAGVKRVNAVKLCEFVLRYNVFSWPAFRIYEECQPCTVALLVPQVDLHLLTGKWITQSTVNSPGMTRHGTCPSLGVTKWMGTSPENIEGVSSDQEYLGLSIMIFPLNIWNLVECLTYHDIPKRDNDINWK
jgi:hypothetical protein